MRAHRGSRNAWVLGGANKHERRRRTREHCEQVRRAFLEHGKRSGAGRPSYRKILAEPVLAKGRGESGGEDGLKVRHDRSAAVVLRGAHSRRRVKGAAVGLLLRKEEIDTLR